QATVLKPLAGLQLGDLLAQSTGIRIRSGASQPHGSLADRRWDYGNRTMNIIWRQLCVRKLVVRWIHIIAVDFRQSGPSYRADRYAITDLTSLTLQISWRRRAMPPPPPCPEMSRPSRRSTRYRTLKPSHSHVPENSHLCVFSVPEQW